MSGPDGDKRNGGHRILVVVRDDELRVALARALRAAHHDVLAYDDAATAMMRIRNDRIVPTSVILDWGLAGWSSAEFLRYLVSRPQYVRTRVVVLSDRPQNIPTLCVAAVLPRHAAPAQIIAAAHAIILGTADLESGGVSRE